MPTILPPTKLESRIRAIAYFIIGTAGVWVLVLPPITISRHIGWLTVAWGICLLTAYIASWASWKRRYRIEYTALPLTVVGVVIYTGISWMLVPDTITRGTQALFLTAILCFLAIRFATLYRLIVSWKGRPWIGSLQ